MSLGDERHVLQVQRAQAACFFREDWQRRVRVRVRVRAQAACFFREDWQRRREGAGERMCSLPTM